MRIINLGRLDDINALSTIENNEKFVIKYMIKKIDIQLPIKTSLKIKNKKNIICNYDKNKSTKRIEVRCQGLLFSKKYINANEIEIFTINKKDEQNNVLCVKINLEKKEGIIVKLKKYKQYKKYDILQIGSGIIKNYIKDNIIDNCIISHDCIFYPRNIFYNTFYNTNPIFKKKIEELDILFGFYKEYIKYKKYYRIIHIYYTNETFEERLQRLIFYRKYYTYSSIKSDTFNTYLYDVVIRNAEIIPEKYNSSLRDPILKKQYSEKIIEWMYEDTIKNIEYYKNNKYRYLEKFYNNIDAKILSDSKYFSKYDDIINKIIEEELKNIYIEDIKNYIKIGIDEISNNKETIIKLFNIKNIDNWFIYIHKKYSKIENLKDYECKRNDIEVLKKFFRYYPLFIELLVIVNTFYEDKNIELKYDFTKNIERMKHILVILIDSYYIMNMR